MLIIGLTGKAGAGKDTVGAHLARKLNLDLYAFADPIKAAICAAFHLPKYYFTDRNKKEDVIPWIGKSPRQLAQLFGTEFGRDLVHPEIWIKVAQKHLDNLQDETLNSQSGVIDFDVPHGLVVTDVRFPNEALWIIENGGYVIEVIRPSASSVAAHSSEDGLPKMLISGTIHNDGSIPQLLERANALVDALATGKAA